MPHTRCSRPVAGSLIRRNGMLAQRPRDTSYRQYALLGNVHRRLVTEVVTRSQLCGFQRLTTCAKMKFLNV